MQWLKLYYNYQLTTKSTDKYLYYRYVSDIRGDQYLIPLLGVWDIDFDSIPN